VQRHSREPCRENLLRLSAVIMGNGGSDNGKNKEATGTPSAFSFSASSLPWVSNEPALPSVTNFGGYRSEIRS